ncbi:MAG: FG-GAP repeat protein [Acidobacteria bacterium]|nr:FG-GAP repeat protein [Acidobacteriota bacterium]MBI3426704.1 FG-GAP repeat protein [Acidobacteriota bacterium]
MKDAPPVSLSLRGIGYGDASRQVGAGVVSGDLQTLTITRDSQFTEWFVNGAEGLEHGFTLNQPPPPAQSANSSSQIRLALTVNAGWQVSMRADGQAARFTHAASGQSLAYDHLAAYDAQGRALPAWLEAQADTLALLVDDAGAVYPLMIDPIFSQQAKLSAPDAAANDAFGDSVALDGNTAVVGAPFDDGSGANQASVYVFVRSDTVWTFQAKLAAVDGATSDQFGFAFALSGDTLVVGAPFDDIDQDSVYVFTRSGTSWSQQQKLTASDGATGDHFGVAVALSGNTFVAGASDDNISANADQGSAYVFTRSGTAWMFQQKLTANDGAAFDFFGV